MLTTYHPDYQRYFFGKQHPFNPKRYRMVLDLLKELEHEVEIEKPEPVPDELLLSIHSEDFVDAVKHPDSVPSLHEFGFSSGDTPPFEHMHEAASLMAGGTVAGAEQIASGNTKRALQLGGGLHHAHASRASGFCIYNDLALGIARLRDTFRRIAYIDIDVHHGDGVQSIFYDEPDVMTISFHESGQYLYPGTGFVREIGEGVGKGRSLNMPLQPGTTDAEYLRLFEKIVPHALNWFHPDVLVVQCGADAHQDDPLGHLKLTTNAYQKLFQRLLRLADKHTEGRILCTLGGGYNYSVTTRIWTLLYLTLTDSPIPDQLPKTWLESWKEAQSGNTFMDAAPTGEATDKVREHHDQHASQLLNRLARSWRR